MFKKFLNISICLLEALFGAGISEASAAFVNWIRAAAFSVGSFPATFTIGYAINYGICI